MYHSLYLATLYVQTRVLDVQESSECIILCCMYRLVIRGDRQDEAVLCTSDKTFELRQAHTSNSLLLCPSLHYPKDKGLVKSYQCIIFNSVQTWKVIIKTLFFQNKYIETECFVVIPFTGIIVFV